MSEQQQDQSQKTEEPTQKKLEDARKKGQGVSSREVNNWFILLAGAILVMVLLPGMMADITMALRPFIERPHSIAVGEGEAPLGLGRLGLQLFGILMIPFGLFVVAAFAAGLMQRGLNFSVEPITPKWEKISPLKGLKRLFSMRSFAEFIKGIAKIVIVGGVGAVVVVPKMDRLELLPTMTTPQALDLLHTMVIALLISVVAVMTVIAGLDFMYQRFEFLKQMRMSRQEIKDEHKQTEGDPIVKSRIRQLRQDRARRRMIAAVPEADVVVTNPTHYAVALKYDSAKMAAPLVVAKGIDQLAQKIREVAEENEVPIVENPPLARSLHAAVDVDEPVPIEHYQAVAEIIGYVWRLKGKMARKGAGSGRMR